jgi:hypothetical protein
MQNKGGREMKAESERKPYEKPQVVLDRDLEAMAADCGDQPGSTYLGGNNCKGYQECTIPYS